jgi:diguanylate cyclase
VDSNVKLGERLIFSANLLAIAFCIAVTKLNFARDANAFAYLVAAVGMLALYYFSVMQFPKYRWPVFLILLLLITYIYINTPYAFAAILFYLCAIYTAMTVDWPLAVVGGVMIAGVYGISSSLFLERTQYHFLLTAMNVLLLIHVNVLTQHLVSDRNEACRKMVQAGQRIMRMETAYQEVKSLAERDGLTGLYNYRYFRELMERSSPQSMTLLLLDIDYFKSFNDIYGHLCGDAILKDLAGILRFSVREQDMIFRYGGEEFAVIMEGNTDNKAAAAARRIAKNIAAYKFSAQGEKTVKVTVSIGYAIGHDEIKDAQALFRIADAALYRAKNSGRNLIGCPDGSLLN